MPRNVIIANMPQLRKVVKCVAFIEIASSRCALGSIVISRQFLIALVALCGFAQPCYSAKSLEAILDGDRNSCGPLALQVCAVYQGLNIDLKELENALERRGRMCDLEDLEAAAQKFGLSTKRVAWNDSMPDCFANTAIIQVFRGASPHFIVITEKLDGSLRAIDLFRKSSVQDIPEDVLRGAMGWDGKGLIIAQDSSEIASFLYCTYRTTVLFSVSCVLAALLSLRFFRGTAKASSLKGLVVAVIAPLCASCAERAPVQFSSQSYEILQNATEVVGQEWLELRNTSKHDYYIVDAQSSCSCVSVRLPSDLRLAAGSVTTLTAEGHFPDYGERRASVLVAYEQLGGGQRSGDELSLSARTTVAVRSSKVSIPRLLERPRGYATEYCSLSDSLHVELHTLEHVTDDFWITSCRITAEGGVFDESIPVYEISTNKAGDSIDRTYGIDERRLLEMLKGRSVQGFVSFYSGESHEHQELVAAIPFELKYCSPFNVYPQMKVVEVGVGIEDEPFYLDVNTRADQPFRVVSVATTPTWVESQLEDAEESGGLIRQRVRCLVRKSEHLSGPAKGEVVFTTNHPWSPCIRVPIEIALQSVLRSVDVDSEAMD